MAWEPFGALVGTKLSLHGWFLAEEGCTSVGYACVSWTTWSSLPFIKIKLI